MTAEFDVTYPRPAVLAYRQDLERIGERPVLRTPAIDLRWLKDAMWLERQAWFTRRASDAPRANILNAVRSRFRATGTRASILEGAADLECSVAEVLHRAENMEKCGGLALALSSISAARVVWSGSAPNGATLALVHMGRIARSLGDHGTAWTLYVNAERDAKRIKFAVARTRALLGQGAIHHEAGRLAEAADRYRAATRVARDNAQVRSMAWLGLSSIAHREGHVAASLDLGLRALLDAPDSPGRRAEVLVNIAHAALAAGQPAIAADAAHWVLRRKVHERSRYLAIAASALAAARLGRWETVRRCVALARREASSSSLPYPMALMWTFVARAESESGFQRESRGAAVRAKKIAARHGFVGIEAEADRLLAAGAVGPAVSGELVGRLELAIHAL